MQTNTLILVQSFLIISNIWSAANNATLAIVWFVAAALCYIMAFVQRGKDA